MSRMSADGRAPLLMVTPDFPPAHGGIQVLMHRLAEHLREHDPCVVTLGDRGSRRFDRASGLRVRRVPAGGRLHRASVGMLNARGVAEALRARPAAVLCGHVVAAPAALLAGRLTGAPVVQYVHADEFRARPALSARAVRGADATVAVSRYTRGLALAAGAPADRLHLIHPGVDLPEGRGAERARRPTLLTVARLTEHKGHDVVLAALPAVRRRVPDIEWIVVGDGPRREALERLARDHGVADAVRFTGAVAPAERDRWLDRAHAFVMPSRVPDGGVGGEGFGIAFVEAGAHGLPVLAGDRGGACDAVRDGETGLLVDAADPAAVARGLIALLTDAPLAARLGAGGAARARELAWPRVAAAVEDVLRGLRA
jgi:phosphatidylinositol alpha-1,6-mannosyltransferase